MWNAESVGNLLRLIPFLTIGPGGVAFALAPGFCLKLFSGRSFQLNEEVAAGLAVMRIIGVSGAALGLLAILGWMTQTKSLRRAFARCLFVFFTVWGSTMLRNYLHDRSAYSLVPVATLIAFAYLSALISLVDAWGVGRDPRPKLIGTASTRHTWTWWLWALQAFYLFGSAILIAGWLHRVVGAVMQPAVVDPYVLDQFRLNACYLTGIGLFSLVALRDQRDWVWRALARVFVFSLGGTLLATVVVYTPLLWTPWAIVWVSPMLLFVAGNVAALVAPQPTWLEDVPEAIEGWTTADVVPGGPMGLQTLMTRRRASHLMGVGATGRFVVAPLEPVRGKVRPDSAFFTPGAEFPLRMRFANLTLLDDAGLDVRGAAIKLANSEWESPFDMVMNTGAFCPAGDIIGFTGFVLSKFTPEWMEGMVLRQQPLLMEGAIAGLRRAPDSYAGLRFYSQIVRGWQEPDGTQHLVRYRLVPVGDLPETGLPDQADCTHPWIRARLPSERRVSDYLRREMKERLAREPVVLRFEAQFHPFAPTLPDPWYDASIEWEEGSHPWLPLGEIRLDAALPDMEIERTRFSPTNRPPSLIVFGSTGWRDPRSLGDSEVRVMDRLQKFRLWLEKWGPLKFGPVANIKGADR